MKRYAAILADPPWRFKTYSAKGRAWCADRHYVCEETQTLEQMTPPAADDACLFLWTTDPMLPSALGLMDAWGFAYKTVAFTWMKTNRDGSLFTGMGYWTRSNPEMCLLGTRGKPKRIRKDVRQAILSPRREHSRKPDCIYERIERLVDGPYLEMFSRSTRRGWDAWGNEVGKFGEIT